AHDVPADEHIKKHKRWSWLPWIKKKPKPTLMTAPSSNEFIVETSMGVEAEN
ncbi:hypothetical protein ACJMK2_002091, partial [Sinanodonta woodiana]